MKIRVGIIGGNFGKNVLLPAALANQRMNIVGASFSSTNNAYFDSQLNLEILSATDLIHKKEIEMLLIAVPPQNQTSMVKEAIKKGIHIFIEKPLLGNADLLTNNFENKPPKIYINYIFKELSEFIFIQNYVLKKGIENVISYEFHLNCYSKSFLSGIDNWRFHKDLGGGGLSNLLSHFIALFQLFFGNVSQADAELNNFKGKSFFFDESSGRINLIHQNGIQGKLNFDACFEGNPEIYLKIIFQNNLIILKNNNLNYFKDFQLEVDKKLITLIESADINLAVEPRILLMKKHLNNFLDSLESNNQPMLDLNLAFKVNNILSLIRDSAKEKNEKI